MLNVPINDKYRVTSDAHNFMIQKYYPKAKKDKWKPVKWYPNIDSLLWGLFNQAIRLSSCVSLQELAVCVKEAKRQVDTIRVAVLSNTPESSYNRVPTLKDFFGPGARLITKAAKTGD